MTVRSGPVYSCSLQQGYSSLQWGSGRLMLSHGYLTEFFRNGTGHSRNINQLGENHFCVGPIYLIKTPSSKNGEIEVKLE